MSINHEIGKQLSYDIIDDFTSKKARKQIFLGERKTDHTDLDHKVVMLYSYICILFFIDCAITWMLVHYMLIYLSKFSLVFFTILEWWVKVYSGFVFMLCLLLMPPQSLN